MIRNRMTHSARGWHEKTLFALLSILALTLPFDGYNVIGLGSLFRIIAPFVLFIFVLFLLMNPSLHKRFVDKLFSTIGVGLLLFVIWSGVTCLWAPNKDWALSRFFTYLGLLGITFSVSVLPLDRVAGLWLAMFLGVLISLPMGFIVPHPNPLVELANRFSSGGKDPNDYANLVLIVLFVCIFGVLSYVREISKRSIFLLGSLALMAIPLSGSRTALLNLSSLTAFASVGRDLRSKRTVFTIAVIVIAFFFILREAGPLSTFFDTFAKRSASLIHIRDENTLSRRADLWITAWHVFIQNPIGGVGLNNFAWVSPQYSSTAALIASLREGGKGGVAHNSFLSVLAETGIVGFVLFVSLQLMLFFSLHRRRHNPLAKGFLIGLIGYWIASLTLTWEYVKIPFFLYGSVLALAREVPAGR